MNKYYCKCCDYNAKVKSSYDKHLKTKIYGVIQKSTFTTKSQHLVNQSQHFTRFDIVTISCHCNKHFKFKQSMYKHIKYTCKKQG